MPLPGPVAIILAAGHGKRMRSETAKVLHELCGRPMLHYVVDAVRGAGVRSIVVVVGVGADQVRASLDGYDDVHFAVQEQQRGTGDAVRSARPVLEGYEGPALVVVGDGPLLRPEPLADLMARQSQEHAACTLGTARLDDPTGFGRILRDGAGRFLRIVEQRDCNAEEAAITEVNPSCYVFTLPRLWEILERLSPANAQGELYVTDAPSMLQADGETVLALPALHADDILGVNERKHLAQAHLIMQQRICDQLMESGVTIVDPRTTYIDGRAVIGPDTIIYPFTAITGPVSIGRDCRVGPFAHLRSGTTLEDGVAIGAFVEVNRSHVGSGTQAKHLAYLGDATIGPGVNIGAGAVTANFDGYEKHPTTIGPSAFVGSNTCLIAPVEVGPHATIAAGAVVTKNTQIPEGQTVLGVPARPKTPS